MKTICLYFEIHQIIHLKRYRCFDIGTDHYYYDDYENERSITEIAERSYITGEPLKSLFLFRVWLWNSWRSILPL